MRHYFRRGTREASAIYVILKAPFPAEAFLYKCSLFSAFN